MIADLCIASSMPCVFMCDDGPCFEVIAHVSIRDFTIIDLFSTGILIRKSEVSPSHVYFLLVVFASPGQ